MDTLSFLEEVLPDNGLYSLSANANINTFHSSLEDLLEQASKYPSANVYITAASFSSAARTTANVSQRKSYVVDIDLGRGEGSVLGEQIAEWEAALNEQSSGQGPLTGAGIVFTGGGFHVWIPSRYPAGPGNDSAAYDADWATLERYFKSQFGHLPGKMDWPASKKLAGLYRLPGTRNQKYVPTPLVEIKQPPDYDAFSWDDIRARAAGTPPDVGAAATPPNLLVHSDLESGGPQFLPPPPDYAVAKYGAPRLSDPIRNFDAGDQFSAKQCLAQCAQFNYAFKNLNNGKVVSYDAWVASGKIFREQGYDDGKHNFVTWSANDPTRLNPEEIDEKWDRIMEMYGGLSCQTYSEYLDDPQRERCKGCLHFRENAGSPYLAGRIVQKPSFVPVEHVSTFTTQSFLNTTRPVYLTGGGRGYGIGPGNTLVMSKGSDDGSGEPPKVVAPSPIWAAVQWFDSGVRSRDSRGAASRITTFVVEPPSDADALAAGKRRAPVTFDYDTGEASACTQDFQVAVSKFLCAGPRSVPLFKSYIQHTLEQSVGSSSVSRTRAYDDLGWEKDEHDKIVGFTHGGYSYRGDLLRRECKISPSLDKFVTERGLSTSGEPDKELEVLKLYADEYFSDAARQSLLISFAAPLMTLTTEGSFVVMLAGDTGGGKTTIMRMMSSFWGNPSKVIGSSSATEHAERGAMSIFNNIPFFVDEVSAKEDASTAMLKKALETSQNKGRDRLTQTGQMSEHHENWSTIYIAASNTTKQALLADSMTEVGDAARKRIVEIPFPAGVEHAGEKAKEMKLKLDKLYRELCLNHGHLGLLFVDYVQTNLDKVSKRLESLQREHEFSNAAERFEALAMAACQLSGEIIQELGWVETENWYDKMVFNARKARSKERKPNGPRTGAEAEGHIGREDTREPEAGIETSTAPGEGVGHASGPVVGIAGYGVPEEHVALLKGQPTLSPLDEMQPMDPTSPPTTDPQYFHMLLELRSQLSNRVIHLKDGRPDMSVSHKLMYPLMGYANEDTQNGWVEWHIHVSALSTIRRGGAPIDARYLAGKYDKCDYAERVRIMSDAPEAVRDMVGTEAIKFRVRYYAQMKGEDE